MTKMTKLTLSTVLSIYAPPRPLRLIKGNKNASRARTRGNLRNHIKRQGRARAREADHSNNHNRGRARGINNISKEPQQKGGLKGGLKTI